MLRRNGLILMALTIGMSLLLAGPAFAKKSNKDSGDDKGSSEFDPENIDECGIQSVNALSVKTEGLATDWSGLKVKVDGIPTRIGEAAGSEVATIDAALEEIIALELPLKIDVAAMSVSIDKEGLDDKKTAMATAVEEVANEIKSVPDAATAVSEKAVALGSEIAAFIPGVAGEFKGSPLKAAMEVPKATTILKGQVDYLTALPEEIKTTVEMIPAFFEGLAAAAVDTAGAVEEAATE